ncbi:hypothetical protein [Dyadobacter sp. Leaf189]|uniref:hypothetical protein n=1 Tax=Dyadobacter sp. Leaf189 TaxID=1736295 RepID=UPI0006F7EA4B|nr:hypothetical protein [Dyadobacter sp. Leaf189]KQS33998.1 hypothetical protein ASG33_08180 [Dyadobacter sp. Leaf189]
MQTAELKISVQNAYVAFKNGTAKQKAFLRDLFPDHNFDGDITDRVGSYEDACAIVGINPMTIDNFKPFPEQDREYHFASHKLVTIARVLNEGWQPNWNDSTQAKYYPWFKPAGGSGFSFDDCIYDGSYTTVGSRLVFRTSELATYAGKQFIDIYNIILKN